MARSEQEREIQRQDEQLNVKLNTNVKRRGSMILAVCNCIAGAHLGTRNMRLGREVGGAPNLACS